MGMHDFCAEGAWGLDGARGHAIGLILREETGADGRGDDDVRVSRGRGMGGGRGDGEASGEWGRDLQVVALLVLFRSQDI